MKKTDIAMIILIASISILIAYFVGKALFGDYTSEGVKIKTIDSVSATIEEPSKEIFNEDAINPTVQAHVVGTDSGETSD
ncbi:MAG: hypothetical protein PHO93_00140 [Candidatus Saccharimonadaceae bacterium]|nr:hypothetical protein [Candidatus Saccharimonadaceae bacterium]